MAERSRRRIGRVFRHRGPKANIAVNGDTIFPACSISKFLTEICVMKLREQKMIDIDEPVNGEHDHMGIVLQSTRDTIIAAEGNLNNASGIIERPRDAHIRGYIRIPDGYRYQGFKMDHRTEDLILRFVTEDDLAEVARTWPSDHRPLARARAREAIAHMRGNYGRNAKGSVRHLCLAVCRKERPGTIMGWCGLDGTRNPAEPEIFILLDEAYRSRGYGTQCVRELLRIAVEDYALSGVHGGCAKENVASARAMEKGGMVRYGTEENGDPLFRFMAKEKAGQCKRD